MLKSEFIEILHEISPCHPEPTAEQYDRIEDVYIWYPFSDDKETIVKLWADFGDVIINDMLPRVYRIRDIEERINYLKSEISRESVKARVRYLQHALSEARNYLEEAKK